MKFSDAACCYLLILAPGPSCVLVPCRAVADLAGARVVNFDEVTQRIEPRVEAHVMTKYLVLFPTMRMLTELPLTADNPLAQLLKAICSGSAELSKPVRRAEKRLLNDTMKAIRFPLKLRVQEPWHKAYVLLQAAVGRLEAATGGGFARDFSLRVEQAELVESTLRVLSALSELARERGRGEQLETAILLDRALRIRMWESGYASIFLQCPGLEQQTR